MPDNFEPSNDILFLITDCATDTSVCSLLGFLRGLPAEVLPNLSSMTSLGFLPLGMNTAVPRTVIQRPLTPSTSTSSDLANSDITSI